MRASIVALIVVVLAASCFADEADVSLEELAKKAPRSHFNEGFVLYGWAFAKGTWKHDVGTIADTYTATVVVEDLWGGRLFYASYSYDDYFGQDNSFLAAIPDTGVKTVPVLCSELYCGPALDAENKYFTKTVKNAAFFYANSKLQFEYNGATLTAANMAADGAWVSSIMSAVYRPSMSLTCKNIQSLPPKLSYTIAASGGAISSTTKVTLTTELTLSTSTTTSAEWFMEAAMNGGDKIGLEAPVEGGKLGVESNFGWSVKSGTKISTSTTDTRQIKTTNTVENTLQQNCEQGHTLFKVSRESCVKFNTKNCVPYATLDQYSDVKGLADGEMTNCKSEQFPRCAKDTTEIDTFIKTAAASKKGGSSMASLVGSAPDTVGSVFGALASMFVKKDLTAKLVGKGAPEASAVAAVVSKTNSKSPFAAVFESISKGIAAGVPSGGSSPSLLATNKAPNKPTSGAMA